VFVETSLWIRAQLDQLELPPESRVVDVGSSTLDYRTVKQPHVETNVMAPLRARGAHIVHVDAKSEAGVDVVADVTAPDFDAATLGDPFDLVIVSGLLSVVTNVDRVIRVAAELVAPGGWLVAATPTAYRRTLDPIDNGWRPGAAELADRLVRVGCLEIVVAEGVRIDDARYYRGVVSRSSQVRVRALWVPLPGFTDRIRRALPGLRWREACVLARRPAA
jgi:SAM-dependent methyltransferase